MLQRPSLSRGPPTHVWHRIHSGWVTTPASPSAPCCYSAQGSLKGKRAELAWWHSQIQKTTEQHSQAGSRDPDRRTGKVTVPQGHPPCPPPVPQAGGSQELPGGAAGQAISLHPSLHVCPATHQACTPELLLGNWFQRGSCCLWSQERQSRLQGSGKRTQWGYNLHLYYLFIHQTQNL